MTDKELIYKLRQTLSAIMAVEYENHANWPKDIVALLHDDIKHDDDIGKYISICPKCGAECLCGKHETAECWSCGARL